MKTDDPFETLLAQQTLRSVPTEWRESILATAAAAAPAASSDAKPRVWDILRFLFCPSPRFAVGMAGAWLVILSLNYFSLPTSSLPVKQTVAVSSSVTRMAWLEQQRLRQELLSEEARGPAEPAARPPSVTRPRSARSALIQVC